MSLADACLVRLSELNDDSSVLTLDHHFRIYRKHGRQIIPAIMPPPAPWISCVCQPRLSQSDPGHYSLSGVVACPRPLQ